MSPGQLLPLASARTGRSRAANHPETRVRDHSGFGSAVTSADMRIGRRNR